MSCAREINQGLSKDIPNPIQSQSDMLSDQENATPCKSLLVYSKIVSITSENMRYYNSH